MGKFHNPKDLKIRKYFGFKKYASGPEARESGGLLP
jgi:hypothetical protein